MLHRLNDAVWSAAIFIASTILAAMLTWWIWTIIKTVLAIAFVGGLLLMFLSMV